MLEEKSLGEICSLEEGFIQTGPFGSQLHQSDYTEVGTPVIMPADIIQGKVLEDKIARVDENFAEKLKRHKLEIGDIVFARRGDIGRQALITSREEDWLCGTGCLKVNLGKKQIISPSFLHYYFKLPEVIGYLQNQAIGATMPNLNTEILKRIPIRYPNLENQNKIISILSAYDELIENNKKRIALLETMAEELYKEWFVRFRFPNYENTEFEKGIPKDWVQVNLTDIADITYGYPFDASRFNTDGIGKKIVRIRNIPNSSSNDFTDEIVDEKYIVENGDFLIGMDGDFHMNRWYEEESYLVQRSCRIKAKDKIFDAFIRQAIKAPIHFFQSTILGATVGHLGAKHLNSISFLMPINQLKALFEQLNSIDNLILKLNNENFNLNQQKNQLLPRLISGKLSVKHLNIQQPPTPAQPTDNE